MIRKCHRCFIGRGDHEVVVSGAGIVFYCADCVREATREEMRKYGAVQLRFALHKRHDDGFKVETTIGHQWIADVVKHRRYKHSCKAGHQSYMWFMFEDAVWVGHRVGFGLVDCYRTKQTRIK